MSTKATAGIALSAAVAEQAVTAAAAAVGLHLDAAV